MAHILIAEGEASVRALIAGNLTLVGHECRSVGTGTEALQELERGGLDLALIDAALPGTDGLGVLRESTHRNVPALLLIRRFNLADRARCFALGAEGFLVKPIQTGTLILSVTEALKRARRSESVVSLGDALIDLNAHTASLRGEPVELTPQEYSLLEALIVNRNLALSRERLYTLAWGEGYTEKSRAVDVVIQHLRKKLELESRIKTVYKLGYRLETTPH